MNNNDNNGILKFGENIIRESKSQLPADKKESFGFASGESVLDVKQWGYAISREEDILYAYGIESCCGLVLYDENIRVLFHLDGNVLPEDVIKITNNLGLHQKATALFVPGVTCGIPGSFEYRKLENEYSKIGYTILERKLPATCGFVAVEKDQITIGTSINRRVDRTFSIKFEKHDLQDRNR